MEAAGRARVVPVIVRPCHSQPSPFGKFQLVGVLGAVLLVRPPGHIFGPMLAAMGVVPAITTPARKPTTPQKTVAIVNF